MPEGRSRSATRSAQNAEALQGRGIPRAIAKETNPAIRMVQTIVDEKDGADRTSKKYAEIRKHELKRHVMISYGSGKTRDLVGQQVQELKK